MAAPGRPTLPSKKSTMRPPIMRPPPSRAHSATPAFNGRASPADSLGSMSASVSRMPRSPQSSIHGGTKRKERDFDQDSGEETNINVVVRCRGRSVREVRENSGVVVSTDGVKGNSVELSMGPNALSNKTYHFDKVFSPAADQNIIFDEVVAPILDEVYCLALSSRDAVSLLILVRRFLAALTALFLLMAKQARGKRTQCLVISPICSHYPWMPV